MTDFSLPARHYFIASLILIIGALCAPRALAFLPALCGLSVYAFAAFQQKAVLPLSPKPFFIFAAIVVFVTLSSLWTPTTEDTLERGGKLLLLFGGGAFWIAAAFLAKGDHSPRLIYAAVILYIGAGIILATERCYGMPWDSVIGCIIGQNYAFNYINRSLVVLSLLIVPLLAWLETVSVQKLTVRLWQISVIAALIFALFANKSQTAQLAAIVGITFYYCAPVARAWFWKALATLLVLVILIAPFAVRAIDETGKDFFASNPLTLEASIPHRLEIWGFVSRAALERPLLGHGIEATKHMTSDRWMTFMNADNVLHPHNGTLQVWIEFGLLGVLGYVALLLFLLWRAKEFGEPPAQRTALATLMAALCMANTGYGLWQGWQLGLFVMLCGLVIFINRKHYGVTVLGSSTQ